MNEMKSDEKSLKPGQTVLVRELWQGQVWSTRPMIIVQENKELIALHIPPNTLWKHHYGQNGKSVTIHEHLKNKWILNDTIWGKTHGFLKLAIPRESYSVLLFWNNADDSFLYWYINLEDPENPIHRTTMGFDYIDQILDAIIEPNLKDWRWEDENELLVAIEAGVISPEKARLLYAKGEEVRDMIMSGKSIFNGWENWKPDPAWEIPVLPEGWDVI
jgi:hypothetical protein